MSTKGINTFQFKSFAQQLADINIGVIRQICQESEIPEDSDTFFYEALCKQNELNCTESFADFKRDLPLGIQTLPQLLLHKDEIIRCLLTHLQIPDSSCPISLLELVVGLSRDLQYDFYPYFPAFFKSFITFLSTKDVELLQQLFKTIAYIFKIHWRYMIKDIKNVYSMYLPLLDELYPDYIRKFSAESIAFLLRKVPDKNELLNLIFSIVKDTQYSHGIGMILFQVLRGVQKQFHSNFEQLFYLILTKLGQGLESNDLLPWDEVATCQLHMIDSLMEYTSRELSTNIWNIFMKVITELSEKLLAETIDHSELVLRHLERVLRLLQQAVTFRNAKILQCSTIFIKFLMSLLASNVFSDDMGNPLINIVSCLLLSPHLNFDVATVNCLISSVYNSKCSWDQKALFTKEMYKFGMFEKDVFPSFLKYCQDLLINKQHREEILIAVLSAVLHFRPLPLSSDELYKWNRAHLFLATQASDKIRRKQGETVILKCLEDLFRLQDASDIVQHIPNLWAAVTILPHVSKVQNSSLQVHLMDLYGLLMQRCMKKVIEDSVTFLLLHVVQTMLLVMKVDEIEEVVSLKEILELLMKYPSNINLLKITEFYVSFLEKNKLLNSVSGTLTESLFHWLLPNLASPFYWVRFSTLKIFKRLYTQSSGSEQSENISNVFEICISAESVQVDVHNFRERLQHLQCLDYEFLKSGLSNTGFEKVPLYYLIGTLYVNFQPLWQPTMKLIDSYARGMDSKTFWNIFNDNLISAAKLTENMLISDVSCHSNSKPPWSDVNPDLVALFQEQMSLMNVIEHADYRKHRELLWEILALIPDLSEGQSRVLSPLFLQFMQNEYSFIDLNRASGQDVRKPASTENNMDIGSSSETDISDQEKGKNPKKQSVEIAALCAHLNVFSKFHNPRKLCKEAELRSLYLQLLDHFSIKVQQLAFSCILTYKEAFLVPYKENMCSIIQEKALKSDLVAFHIDSGNSIVHEEHRDGLMPILIRILIGKMQKKNSGKGNEKTPQNRRTTVFHFLAHLKETELQIFLSLVFQSFQKYNDVEDIVSLVNDVLHNQDFSQVIPIKKLRRALMQLNDIFINLSHRLSPYLSWLLALLLNITANIAVLLENKDKINPKYHSVLKTLRVMAITMIMKFFECFFEYPFTKQEIDALFLAAIWPQLPRLHLEGVERPTPLLRLFHHWSTDPRYFILLTKHLSTDATMSPLHEMTKLLAQDKTKPEVISLLLEIVENLLTMQDYDPNIKSEDDDGTSNLTGGVIEVNDAPSVSFDNFSMGREPPNFGTRILLPHLLPILTRLKKMIEKMGKTSKTAIPKRNLTILCRLSEFVRDTGYCTKLLRLLMPFLTKNLARDEDDEIDIFAVVTNLMKLVEHPKQFVRSFCVMFGSQTNRLSRAALCDALDVIAKRDESISHLCKLARKINAWNPRRPEEPDFAARIEGFQYAVQILESNNNDSLFYLLVIYNCCYFITAVEDLSLRDNASYCLQTVLIKLGTLFEIERPFVNNMLATMLPKIRKGLSSKVEAVRHEFITILAVAVKAINGIRAFRDLSQLKNADVDLDFFENIKHIQLHRRARALSRLVKGDILKEFSCDTLIEYIMPMATCFLCNENYVKDKVLVATSIELIGKLCQYLPWHHYEKVLSLYLKILCSNTKYQKIAVKLVIVILDAFNFTLTGLESNEKTILPPPKPSKSEEEVIVIEDDDGDDEISIVGQRKASPNENRSPGDDKTRGLEELIHNKIVKDILPQLHKCLTEKIPNEESHNLASRHHSVDAEMLRVPVAIAMVKLMQKLPKGALENCIPGVLFKICTFLKSRIAKIRKVARDTLLTIMESLGASYVPFLVREMRQILTKGYQVHVMIFTLNAVLRHMLLKLKCGDLDSCLKGLTEICHNELFGPVAEEKGVEKITNKFIEAKATKAYNTYKIMGEFVTSPYVLELVMPLKTLLMETTDHAVVTKAQHCLQEIIFGVVENKSLTSKDFLIFAHGIINEHISVSKHISKAQDEPDVKPVIVRPDSYLIPKEPGRNKTPARPNLRTNSYVLVEFGLKMVYFGLKRSRIVINEQQDLEMLDPFILLFSECLHSSHVQLITFALRLLRWLLKFPLPSLKKHIEEIASSLFTLLKSYSNTGTGQSSSSEMVIACFGVITALLNNVTCYDISEDQLKTMLVYIEQDIHDSNKQAKAFSLLQAILSKELIVPEIHDIMDTVGRLAISSQDEHVRLRCRHCMLKYMLDYPLGDRLDKKLDFFVVHLEYEEEYGVESALEMLTSILTSFPENIVVANAAKFFVHLGACLINDDSIKCRKMSALAIKILIEKISFDERTTLFAIVQSWLQDDKPNHQKLGSQLSGLFVEVEKEKFCTRLPNLFPLLIQQLQDTKHEMVMDNDNIKKSDHLQFQALTTLYKILVNCNLLRNGNWQENLDQMWELVEALLLHPHTWVKLQASQLFGLLFSAYPVDDLLAVIGSSKKSGLPNYLTNNISAKLVSLVKDFCCQLKSSHLLPEIGQQIAKNMVYISKVVHRLPEHLITVLNSDDVHKKAEGEASAVTKEPFQLTFSWLLRKLHHEAQDEVINSPKITTRRTCFFTWIAAVSLDLGKDIVQHHLNHILPLLLREINDTSPTADGSLKALAQEVVDLLKNLVGLDTFSTEYAEAQSGITIKKAIRKRERTAKAVTDPHMAARKKIKKHLALQESRKRKLASLSQGRPVKMHKISKVSR